MLHQWLLNVTCEVRSDLKVIFYSISCPGHMSPCCPHSRYINEHLPGTLTEFSGSRYIDWLPRWRIAFSYIFSIGVVLQICHP